MKTVNETTPLSESLFLKRNAILSTAIGMSIISMIAAKYSKYAFNDMGGIAFSIGFMVGLCIVFLIVMLIKTMKVIPKAKGAWMYGNYQDEYFNHINHRAYKYAFNLTASVVAIFYLMELTITLPSWLVMQFSALVLISLFLTYGISILVWLRQENE